MEQTTADSRPPTDNGTVPKKSKKKAPISIATNPKSQSANSKPVVRRRSSAVDKELKAAMKRLGIAVSPANIEIFKLAAYQVVEAKLVEVAQLLRLISGGRAPLAPTGYAQPTPPARQAMTLENIDRMVARMDGGANSNFEIANSKLPNPNPCQWCGRPGVYKNSRGMWVCTGHRPLAVADDQSDLLRAKLKQGFGGGGDEEVIRVDAGTIQRAIANDQSE